MTLVLPKCIIVDVSHWQVPDTIDWKTAHAEGDVHGVIAKLVQNGSLDTSAVQHLYDAYEAGVEAFGCYDFLTASDDVQSFVNDALKEFQGNISTRLMAFDEEANAGSQVTVAMVETRTEEFYKMQGRYPTQYMGRDGPDGTGKGLPSSILSKCDLWLPKYGPEPDASHLPPGFRLPTNDTESGGVLRLWQFTGDGMHAPTVWPKGIPEKLDLSYAMGFSSLQAFLNWWEGKDAPSA
jgi:Glycosyl hydrolases family 25